ncbi:uncharacterized protein N7483_013171 [Penicillium malachiteum]|uniref:uncharacterized protein n=1 Tax=Penicillium malachiteum TaxID=1324776 RepID=UPI0025498761|nr:uncharacterized protein N7483_013171 [Penicillium malachiteum]KAJ5715990.1 hypothetical protein N7483_013171 [Penicillium malachiteum]
MYVGEVMLEELGIKLAIRADYQCWYNTADAAIIVDLTWYPRTKIMELIAKKMWSSTDQLPAVQQLSDVM